MSVTLAPTLAELTTSWLEAHKRLTAYRLAPDSVTHQEMADAVAALRRADAALNDATSYANPDPLLDYPAAAAYLGISDRNVRRLVAAGVLPAIRPGLGGGRNSAVRIRRSALDAYLNGLSA